MNSKIKNPSLKYQRFPQLGWKDIEMRKVKLCAKAQFKCFYIAPLSLNKLLIKFIDSNSLYYCNNII